MRTIFKTLAVFTGVLVTGFAATLAVAFQVLRQYQDPFPEEDEEARIRKAWAEFEATKERAQKILDDAEDWPEPPEPALTRYDDEPHLPPIGAGRVFDLRGQEYTFDPSTKTYRTIGVKND